METTARTSGGRHTLRHPRPRLVRKGSLRAEQKPSCESSYGRTYTFWIRRFFSSPTQARNLSAILILFLRVHILVLGLTHNIYIYTCWPGCANERLPSHVLGEMLTLLLMLRALRKFLESSAPLPCWTRATIEVSRYTVFWLFRFLSDGVP